MKAISLRMRIYQTAIALRALGYPRWSCTAVAAYAVLRGALTRRPR